MKKIIYFLTALWLTLSACSKNEEKQTLPDPPASSYLSRSFAYPEQGTVWGVRHGNPFTITNSTLSATHLTFHSRSETVTRGGEDAVVFIFDKARLNAGYTGTYSLGTANAPIVAYTFSFKEADGQQWRSVLDSRTGVQYQGSFTIEKYDAERGLISGAYDVSVKDLMKDPAKNSITIDPNDRCNLTLSGAFTDVKVKPTVNPAQ